MWTCVCVMIFTWYHLQVCCCMAPTRGCPQCCPQCSSRPALWHHGRPPRTQPRTYLCFWWGPLSLGLMGYLWAGYKVYLSPKRLLLLWCQSTPLCVLTKLVANSGGFGGVWRLADTGGVAAADAEAVGLPLGEIEECKSWRLNGDLCVHPLPTVCAWDTLRNTDTHLSVSIKALL